MIYRPGVRLLRFDQNKLDPKEVEMQRALAKVARGRRALNKRKVPKPLPATSFQYRLQLVALVREAIKIITEEVIDELPVIEEQAKIDRPDDTRIQEDGVRMDAVEDELDRVFGNVRLRLAQVFTTERTEALAARQAGVVNKSSQASVSRQFRAVLGIDLPASGSTAAQTRLFVRENAQLIKSLPDQLIAKVETAVNAGARQGLRATEIAANIRKTTGASLSRARLIARDQTNKLNGELNQLRQRGVGVTEYIWRNSDDDRVRGNPSGLYPDAEFNHWDREGVTFRWDNPPEDGHPGEAINCRCRAEPKFDNVLADLGI